MLAGQGGADHASGQGGSWKEGGGDAAGGGDEEGEVNSLEISEISKSSIGSQRSQKILLDPTLTLTMSTLLIWLKLLAILAMLTLSNVHCPIRDASASKNCAFRNGFP